MSSSNQAVLLLRRWSSDKTELDLHVERCGLTVNGKCFVGYYEGVVTIKLAANETEVLLILNKEEATILDAWSLPEGEGVLLTSPNGERCFIQNKSTQSAIPSTSTSTRAQ